MLKRKRVRDGLVEYRGFLLFLLLLGVFRGAIADWNPVPTGSMNPTIIEGDVIWVNKMAYNLKLPFTQVSLALMSEPKRGEIVVFKSDRANKRLVKRLIGLPGDEVALLNNQLNVNGEEAEYQSLSKTQDWNDFTEEFAGFAHTVRFTKIPNHRLKTFRVVKIPKNHYLMLGDNRDNSADSRVYGLVPRSQLIGRASHVLVSFNPQQFYVPRTRRFIMPLI